MGCDRRSYRAFKTQCNRANFNGHDRLSLSLLIADEGSFKDLELSVNSKLFPAKWTAPEGWYSD